MTLMSMFLAKFRTAIATCVVLVQLSVPLATYVLHIGCEHSGCSHSQDQSSCAHGLSCPFHRHRNEKPDDSDEKSHDADQCRICQAAFALTIASPEIAQLARSGAIELLNHGYTARLESAEPYRQPNRGPPTC